MCNTCISQIRRANETPEEKAKRQAVSRAWKQKHPRYWETAQPKEEMALAQTLVLCWNCSLDMIEPDPTGLCDFCKIEMPTVEKLLAVEYPQEDRAVGWETYFRLLSDEELADLINRSQAEQERRKNVRTDISPNAS